MQLRKPTVAPKTTTHDNTWTTTFWQTTHVQVHGKHSRPSTCLCLWAGRTNNTWLPVAAAVAVRAREPVRWSFLGAQTACPRPQASRYTCAGRADLCDAGPHSRLSSRCLHSFGRRRSLGRPRNPRSALACRRPGRLGRPPRPWFPPPVAARPAWFRPGARGTCAHMWSFAVKEVSSTYTRRHTRCLLWDTHLHLARRPHTHTHTHTTHAHPACYAQTHTQYTYLSCQNLGQGISGLGAHIILAVGRRRHLRS